jgi:hypothetical protein
LLSVPKPRRKPKIPGFSSDAGFDDGPPCDATHVAHHVWREIQFRKNAVDAEAILGCVANYWMVEQKGILPDKAPSAKPERCYECDDWQNCDQANGDWQRFPIANKECQES